MAGYHIQTMIYGYQNKSMAGYHIQTMIYGYQNKSMAGYHTQTMIYGYQKATKGCRIPTRNEQNETIYISSNNPQSP